MSLRKTATKEEPHATYTAGDWTWLVLKVNQPGKSPHVGMLRATWMVAAQSPATFGGWDMGDTYSLDVLQYGMLKSSTPEFDEYLAKHS